MRFRLAFRLLLTGLAFAAGPFLRGQSSEAQSVSVYLAAKAAYGQGGAGSFSVSTDVENPDGSFTTINLGASIVTNLGQTLGAGQVYPNIYTAPQTVTLQVGRVYHLLVGTAYTASMTLRANPPPGYNVHFFDTASATYDNVTREYKFSTVDTEAGWDGHFGTTIDLCITPEGTAASGGQAGSATSLSTSGAAWRIFMGSLPNGLSAGYLEMNDRGRAPAGFTDAFDSNALAYVSPSPEIIVHSEGGGGREIFAYEAGVWIQPLVGPAVGYTVKFYHNSQVTDSASAGPSFSGTPFITYTVQQDGSSPTNLKITRSATGPTQTITKVATIRRTGSPWPAYTFTLADWHTDGQPALVTATTVLSAGAATGDHYEAVTLASSTGGTPQVSTVQVASKTFGEAPVYSDSGSGQKESRSINYYESDPTLIGAYARPKLVTANDGNGPWSAYEYFSATYSASMSSIQFNNIGMVLRAHRPFKNTAAPLATADLSLSTAGVVTTYQYATDDYAVVTGRALRPTDELTQIDGVTVAHASTSYVDETTTLDYAGVSLPVVTATRTDYADASTPLVTTTKYVREYSVSTQTATLGQYFGTTPFWGRQLLSMQKPDGSKQVYAYQRGTFTDSTFSFSANISTSPFASAPGKSWHWVDRTASTNPDAASRIVVINGTGSPTNPDGTVNTPWSNDNGFPLQQIYLVEGKSTRVVTIRDLSALVRRAETWAWVGGSFRLVAWVNFTYDSANNLVLRVSNTGATYTATYDGGRKTSETDAAGVAITYDYDDAGRVFSATKIHVGATQVDLRTEYNYDAAGHTITEDTHAASGTEHLIATRVYDDAGRLQNETYPGKGTTGYVYTPVSNQVSISLPNGGSRVELSYVDGQIRQITGDGVVPQFFNCDVPSSDGVRHTSVTLGSSGSSRIQETWTDWLGRTTKTSHPTLVNGVPGLFVETLNYPDSTGLLSSTMCKDGAGNHLYADTLYRYDPLGQLIRTALHLDGGTAPNEGGSDRIADTKQFFEQYPTGGEWWLTTQTLTYPTLNSGASKLVSQTRQRLTFTGAGNLQAETIGMDIDGNITDTQTTVDRSAHTTTVSTTSTGYAATVTTVAINGLVSTQTGFDGLASTTHYDALQRPNQSLDPLNRTTTTVYFPGTALPNQVTDPATNHVVTYEYDAAGRVTAVADAVGNVTRAKYNRRNQILHQWGSATYPVSYAYSVYGERIAMRTFHGSATDFTGTGWPLTDGGSDPNNPDPALWGSGDKTSWAYDPATGLVTSKTDAAGKAVTFTYDGRGQAATRTAARRVANNPAKPLLVATYNYDGNTGELTDLTYNDANEPIPTPAVHYSYTRLGQLKTVVDATSASATDPRTFAYDPSTPWRLSSETMTGYYGSRVVTPLYDDQAGTVLGRGRGFQLGTSAGSNSDLEQSWGFTTAGRFDTLASKRSANSVSRSFHYGYLAQAPVVNALSVVGGSFTVAYGYDEGPRDVLTSVDSKWGGAARTRYEYIYNTLGQRYTAKQQGDSASGAFADFGGSIYRRYVYDARGEITSAADYLGETPTPLSGTPDGSAQLPSRNFAYAFDNIGNRQSAGRNGTLGLDTFTLDSAHAPLNQYSSRINFYARAAGTVSGNTTSVTAAGGGLGWATGRKGRFWAADAQLPANNPMAATPLGVTAVTTNGVSAGVDLVYTDTAHMAFLLPQTQSFSYDDDGNLLGDGMWNYVYDAENRLVQMTTTSAASNAGFPNRTLEFKYDYLGRRVQKRSLNASVNPVTDTYRRYLYDGDNVVAEFDVTNSGTVCGSLLKSYTWGLDIASSVGATGGVGALLQITDHGSGTSYLPTYDGNGNVASLLNATTGDIVARYEYSPFGELLRSEVNHALGQTEKDALAAQPFRFSTKFTDCETGLIYYGQRYYSPSLGRWVNRDPIEEAGGINLYGFCDNDAVGGADYLGLKDDKNQQPDNRSLLDFGHSVKTISFNEIPWENSQGNVKASFLGAGQGGLDRLSNELAVQQTRNDRNHAQNTTTYAPNSADFGTITARSSRRSIYRDGNSEFNTEDQFENYLRHKYSGIPMEIRIGMADEIQHLPGMLLAALQASLTSLKAHPEMMIGPGELGGGAIVGAITRESIAAAESTIIRMPLGQSRALESLGVDAAKWQAFLNGEAVAIRFPTKGGSNVIGYLQFQDTQLTSQLFSIRNTNPVAATKAFLQFRNQSLNLARDIGATSVELQGGSVKNPEVAEFLSRNGYKTKTVPIPDVLLGGTQDVMFKIIPIK